LAVNPWFLRLPAYRPRSTESVHTADSSQYCGLDRIDPCDEGAVLNVEVEGSCGPAGGVGVRGRGAAYRCRGVVGAQGAGGVVPPGGPATGRVAVDLAGSASGAGVQRRCAPGRCRAGWRARIAVAGIAP